MVPKTSPMTSYTDEVELSDFTTAETSQRGGDMSKSGGAKLLAKDTDLGNGSALLESDDEAQDDADDENVEQPLIRREEGDDSPRAVDEEQSQEKCLNIAFQVFIPYIIAGLGTVGAGLVLDVVQVCNCLVDQCTRGSEMFSSCGLERLFMVRWVIRSILHCRPVELFPWYVLSCLWDGAYKRTLAANQKEYPMWQ